MTKTEIEQVIIDLLDEQQWRLIVPAQVYNVLGKHGKCCRCLPNVSQMIVKITEQYHVEKTHELSVPHFPIIKGNIDNHN